MPTYEYECTKCSHRFEKVQSITEQPLKRCPKCRHKIRRLLGTGVGIIFKGRGFYQTDYRSATYKEAEKKEKSASQAGQGNKEDSSGKTKETKEGKKPKE